MMRLIIAGLACIGLIALFTLVVARLIRSRRRGLSVRMQVFLALATIVGAFAVGLGILVIDRIEARAQRLAVAAAEDEAHAIAALLRSEMNRSKLEFSELAAQLEEGFPTERSLDGVARRVPRGEMSSLGVELLDLDGTVLFPAGTRSRAQEKGAVFVDKKIVISSKPVGLVRIVKPTIVVQAMLADFAPTVLVISLVLGAAAAAAAAFIGRTIAAPIEALSDYTKRVSIGERPNLPAQVIGREVARLVTSIDTMRERLEGRPFVETFAADLSHELKNPVAAVRASAEVLLEGALDEPEQAQRFVARIHEAAVRIERLLAELLSLAEVETRGPEHLDVLDVTSLLERILETHVGQASRIESKSSSPATIRGDEVWLARALSNLVDNALVHSPPESPVLIEVIVSPTEVQIRVTNHGSLDDHVRKSLFRRFVTTRRDAGARASVSPSCEQLREAHGGHAELSPSPLGKVSFQMSLPRAELRPSTSAIGAS